MGMQDTCAGSITGPRRQRLITHARGVDALLHSSPDVFPTQISSQTISFEASQRAIGTKRSATSDARNRYNLEGEEDRHPSVSHDAGRRGFAGP